MEFQPALIPHLPKDKASFSVSLILEGTALVRETDLTIEAHNELGHFLGEAQLTLAPAERRVLALNALFDLEDISHLTITPGAPLVSASVAYAHLANPEKMAYLEAPSQLSQQWRVYLDPASDVFQGVAVVNADFAKSQLAVTQHDTTGRPIGPSLQEELPAFGKLLLDLTHRFPHVPGSYVTLSADHFIAVAGLKGNPDPDEGFLVAREAQPMPPNPERWTEWLRNREIWRNSELSENHRFHFQLQEITIAGPRTVVDALGEMRDLSLVSLTDTLGAPLDAASAKQTLTVEELFGLIKNLLETTDYAAVAYDEALGYPRSLDLIIPGYADTGLLYRLEVEAPAQ